MKHYKKSTIKKIKQFRKNHKPESKSWRSLLMDIFITSGITIFTIYLNNIGIIHLVIKEH